MTETESVKKLPMRTLQETMNLMERGVEELATQYSFYDELSGFPNVLRFVRFIERHGGRHPYANEYKRRVDRITERFPGSDPEIMHVSFREANARYEEAIELGREIGVIDIEERGEREGGGGIVRVEEAAPEIFLRPWIEDRIWNKQQNALIAVVGLPGSGKSYGAIEIAELLVERSKVSKDRQFRFDPAKDVIFDIETLVDMGYRYDEKPVRGQIFVFDDMGVGAGNRDWQSDWNIILGKIAQSFRSKGWILLVTMPKIELIEKQVRELIAAKLITMTDENGQNLVGSYTLEVGCQFGEDIAYLPPNLSPKDFPDGIGFELHADKMMLMSVHLRKPPKKITDAYEAKKEKELGEQILRLRNQIEEAKNMDAVRREALTAKYTALKDKVEELADADVEAKKAKFAAEKEEAETRMQKTLRERQIIRMQTRRKKDGGK